MAGRLFALLIGIDDYPSPVPRLGGCVNDLTAFAAVLRGRVPGDALELRTLTDGAATRAAVVEALRAHLGRAGPDDVALLYYSGHGSQQEAPPEFWALEPDRRMETLVLVDSRLPGSWDLADKELAVLLREVGARAGHVLTVLDCCHSGDGTRTADGALRLRLAPADDRVRPAAAFLPGVAELADAAATTRSVTPRWSADGGSQVLLAACRSTETAKEVRELGQGRGALSVALEAALRENGPLTYRQVHRHVTAAVMRRVEAQHPQLEASATADLDRPFLGGAVPPTPRRLTLSHSRDGWSVDAGAVHGVPDAVGGDATQLAIHPLVGGPASLAAGSAAGSAPASSTPPLATATVTRVLADRSLVQLSTPLDEGFVYSAVITSIPLRPLRVAVTGDDAGAAALRAAAAAADGALVELVPAAPADGVAAAADADAGTDADIVVAATPDGFAITRPGVVRPLVPVVAGEGRERRTLAALEHVARWLRLAALHNPVTRLPEEAVAVEIVTPGGGLGSDGRVEIRYEGGVAPSFTVTLRNRTAAPLWCTLIDLTETYGIFADAFPAGSVALGPGESTAVALVGQVPDALWAAGTVTVTDHLKVVTSTVEFDPRSLQQDELDVTVVGSAPVVRGEVHPRSTLERLLGRVVTRRLGPPAPTEASADWRTDDVFVLTTRPRA